MRTTKDFELELVEDPRSEPKPVRPEREGGHGYAPGSVLAVSQYTRERFLRECEGFLYPLRGCRSLEGARETLRDRVMRLRVDNTMDADEPWSREVVRIRDCTRAFLTILSARSDRKTGFSVARALWDLARGVPRDDLKPGFFAEMVHLVWAVESRTVDSSLYEERAVSGDFEGREAALVRSSELGHLWDLVEAWMGRYEHGLTEGSIARRRERREEILEALGGTEEDWRDWRWHLGHVGRSLDTLKGLVDLTPEEAVNISRTCKSRLPFGVTPFYMSLMDGERSGRDRAIRAQVFPPARYVGAMARNRDRREEAFDFMGEHDTSPVDLVTRRYPGVVILKPYNTCPQICVYCQRNWEIDEVLAPDAMAQWGDIEAAVRWIGDRPAVHEVLVTGGDPLLLEDADIERVLGMLADLPSIHRIRIGTRTPVTLPMRLTEDLADLLGRLRDPPRREVAVVTHVQHPYEVNPDMCAAVDRLRLRGIPVYNQLVYTFYVSRRFETALLRRLLRRVGIDPYYTFLPKGKSETSDYRVPLSRLLQEQAEEARLLPGLSRTDEAVYNVPRLGKNYLRASQHRDLLTIAPDGTRIYEFHPWEKNIVGQRSYMGDVVPILEYLSRIESESGDCARDYESIWYYF